MSEQEEAYIEARNIANNPKTDVIQNARTQMDAENEDVNKGFWNDIEQGTKEAPWAIAGGIADFGNETWKFLGLNSASEWINERLPDGIRELSDDMRGHDLDDTPLPVIAQPKSNTGKVIRGSTQFFTGFIPVLGQVNKLKWVQKGGKLRQSITKGSLAGAPVDFAGFNPNDPNAANWLGSKLDSHPELQSLVLDYLGTNVDDPAIFNRFKNAFVGASIGILAEPVVAGGIRVTKPMINSLIDRIREFKLQRARERGKKDLGITEDDLGKTLSDNEADKLNADSGLEEPSSLSKTPTAEEHTPIPMSEQPQSSSIIWKKDTGANDPTLPPKDGEAPIPPKDGEAPIDSAKAMNEESGTTALARDKISTPTEKVAKEAKKQDFKGNTLHHGAGQDGSRTTKGGKTIRANPDREFLERITEGETVHYDPEFSPDRSRLGKQDFKTVVSNFVFNVIAGAENRAAAFVDIATSMADDGVGHIAVRGINDVPPNKLTGDPKIDKQVQKKLNSKNWEPFEDGWKVKTGEGKARFQKGFSADELERTLLEHFDEVVVGTSKNGSVTHAKVGKPKRFDERVRPPKPAPELPKVFTDRGIQSPYLTVRPGQLDDLTEALVNQDFRGTLENTDINFDYIKTTEDVKQAIDTVSNLGGADKATVTFKETEELASFAGTSIKNINEMYHSTKGLGSKVLAARRVLVASAEHMMKLAKNAEDTGLVGDQLKVRRQVYIHAGIQKEISGIKSEIGRALNAMKIEARGADAKLAQIDSLVSSFGGRDSLDKFVASINHLAKQENAALRISQFSKRGAAARTMDAILEAYITGLLWNPKTQIINALGSASASILGVLERRYAEHINPTTKKFKFKRQVGDGTDNRIIAGEAHAMLVGLKTGYKEAFDLAMKAWRTDTPSDKFTKTDVYTQGEKAMSASRLHLRGATGAVADWLANVLGLSTKALMSGDEFFKMINYRMHLHSLAHRRASNLELVGKDYGDAVDEIVRNPEPELHMESLDFGRYNTFTEDLAKGSRSKLVQQWIETEYDHPGGVALKGALKAYIPFFRTPVNLVRFSAERTPVMRWFSKRLKDDLGSSDPARVQMAKAKIAGGNLVAFNVMSLAELGLITGAPPTDRELNANQRRVGWQPYSIVIPHQANPFSDTDTYVPYNRLDPVGMSMGLMADYYQGSLSIMNGISRGMDEGFHDLVTEDLSSAAGMITFAIVRNLEDKAYMQGISNMMGLLQQDPNRSAEQITKDMINVVPPISFMSALRRGVTRTIDPIRRVTDDATITDEITNVIYSNIPGFSSQLSAHRDLEGNPEYYPGNKTNVLMRGFNNLLNPASPSEITNSKVDRKVQELKVDLTDMRTVRTVTVDGTRLTLSNDQIDYVSKAWGAYNKKIPLDSKGFNTGNLKADQTNLKATLLQNKNNAIELLLGTYPELRVKAQELKLRQQQELVEHESPLYEVFR